MANKLHHPTSILERPVGVVSLREYVATLLRLLKFFYEAWGPLNSFGFLLLLTVRALIPNVALTYAIARIIDAVGNGLGISTIYPWASVIIFIIFWNYLFDTRFGLTSTWERRLFIKLDQYINYAWLNALQNYPIAILENPNFNALTARADRVWRGNEIGVLLKELRGVINSLIFIFTVGAYVILRFPILVFILVVVSILLGIVWYRFVVRRNKYSDAFREARLSTKGVLVELFNIRNYINLKYYGFVSYIAKNFSYGSRIMPEVIETLNFKLGMKSWIPSRLIMGIIHTLIFIYFLKLLFTGGISVGEFTFYLRMVTDLAVKISFVVASMSFMYSEAYYLWLFFRFLDGSVKAELENKILQDLPSKRRRYILRHLNKYAPKSLNGSDIVIKNLWFKYPNAKEYALKNINLHIPYGKNIAIVGENGAGKTTLIKLILGAYPNYAGKLLVGDKEPFEYKQDIYLKQFSSLPQEVVRLGFLTAGQIIMLDKIVSFGSRKLEPRDFSLAGLFRNNKEYEQMWRDLMAGKIKNFYTQYIVLRKHRVKVHNRLVWAAQKAYIYDAILKLPFKFNTPLSPTFEAGVGLSLGQWQRLHLARVFYAPRDILLLDEPTSAVDPKTALDIVDNIFEEFKDRTVIMVSHKYSTILQADYIYVFKSGEIIEQGTAKELVAKGGYFTQAYRKERERLQV